MTNFANSKTSLRKNLQGVNNAYFSGNNHWFDCSKYGHNEDQNLHIDFNWKGQRFFLVETVGSSNGGAQFSSVDVTQYGTDNVVYSDRKHDGNGAWQTEDSSDAACGYSKFTIYLLKILRAYAE